jgi:hypothetical protein
METTNQQEPTPDEQATHQRCLSHEKDLAAISNALADIAITNRLDSTVVLWGVQAYLMAMVASGCADRLAVGLELHRMAGYWLQADC